MLSKKPAPVIATKAENNSNAVEKVLNVIDCIFQNDSLSFTEIKNQLNLPKATLHRVLSALEDNDFVVKDSKTDNYSLGIKFIYYGEALKGKLTLAGIVENFVKDLAKATNETASVSIPYDNYAISLMSVEGEASALTSKLVPISCLNCSASGKLFLSARSEEAIQAYFKSDLCTKRTVNSICTYEDFKKEQANIKAQGLSFDNEEYEYGLYCITAPIYNHQQRLIASFGVSGPLARMRMRDLPAIEALLREKSAEITEVLTKIRYEPEY